jgi:hypothetical protein
VKFKLAALWVALTFLYAYGDIIAYFRPGYVEDVMDLPFGTARASHVNGHPSSRS